MAHHYDATFSLITLSLKSIVERIEPILIEFGCRFENEIHQLVNTDGTPGVETAKTVSVNSLAEVPMVAARFWGVSLYCVSEDAGEIYIRIFKAGQVGFHVQYNESSSAFRQRIEDSRLAERLTGFLLRMAATLSAKACVYDMESVDGFVDASPETIRALLQSGRFASERDRGLLLLSADSLPLEEASALAPHLGSVKLSTNGYIVMNFL